jgi:NAD(P)-dependent dehydrogenase (short-subunit alcohol dehydrogenase family)
MSRRLAGKIALITGGSEGIGFATAQHFIDEGAFVYITGRRQKELAVAAESLGAQATAVRADAGNLSDLDALYAQISREKGRLDVLFANAGGAAAAPIEKVTAEHFDQIFDTNVKGVVFTVQKALALMPDGGAIVLTGSYVSNQGKPGLSVYSASKAAVRSLARGWTSDLKDRKIRVNVVSPGPVDTPGVRGVLPDEEQRKAIYARLAATVPLGRLGLAAEIAQAVVFLASDAASYISGVDLCVDGGADQV